MAKNNGKNSEKGSQDEKKKVNYAKKEANFNKFGWYLAWLGFFSVVGSSLFKLIKNMEQPKKDDYYK